jgi:SPP1 family predicted phage head-tail adaptor
MIIGKRQKRVGVQSKQTVRDEAGGAITTWVTDDTIWAHIAPATGKELYAGEQVKAELTHKITIRYYSGLTTENRLIYGTRIFDINFIRNIDERDCYQELFCKEVA